MSEKCRVISEKWKTRVSGERLGLGVFSPQRRGGRGGGAEPGFWKSEKCRVISGKWKTGMMLKRLNRQVAKFAKAWVVGRKYGEGVCNPFAENRELECVKDFASQEYRDSGGRRDGLEAGL